jgi:hypothetical protein
MKMQPMSQQPPRWKQALSSLLSAGIGAAAIFAGTLLAPTAALAHNLQTKMVYMFPDPTAQEMLDKRIAGQDACFPSYLPPDPLLRGQMKCDDGTTNYPGDEIGLVIKVVPRDGTTTGVGGHVDFYVPNGVEVIDVGYLLPGDSNPGDGISGFDKVPMKGQSLIAIGAGPIGAKSTAELATLSGAYTNILGVTEAPVVSGTGLHRGTISGVYGDTASSSPPTPTPPTAPGSATPAIRTTTAASSAPTPASPARPSPTTPATSSSPATSGTPSRCTPGASRAPRAP